jgi:hypothetical protein
MSGRDSRLSNIERKTYRVFAKGHDFVYLEPLDTGTPEATLDVRQDVEIVPAGHLAGAVPSGTIHEEALMDALAGLSNDIDGNVQIADVIDVLHRLGEQ